LSLDTAAYTSPEHIPVRFVRLEVLIGSRLHQ
jgi:hypothetical protein